MLVDTADGKNTRAVFVGCDAETGLAILRAESPLAVKPMELGDSTTLKEGDPSLAAGSGGPDAVQGVRVISLGEFAGYWEYLLEHAICTLPAYFVMRIVPDSPAQQADLQAGDIILSVNKHEVKGLADLYRKIHALGPAGVDVPLAVLQGIQIRQITIRSADRCQYLNLKPGR